MVLGRKKKDEVFPGVPPVDKVSTEEQDKERNVIEAEPEEAATEEVAEELTEGKLTEVLENFEIRLRRIEYHLRI